MLLDFVDDFPRGVLTDALVAQLVLLLLAPHGHFASRYANVLLLVLVVSVSIYDICEPLPLVDDLICVRASVSDGLTLVLLQDCELLLVYECLA